MNLNIMVGGEAGQGVQSVGFLLAKSFARNGYHVFADQDYESRVRGGHNFYRIRVSDSPVGAISETVDILLALDEDSVRLHRDAVSQHGVAVFDGDGVAGPANGSDFPVPMVRMAEENAGSKLVANTVAMGVALGLLRFDREIMAEVIRDRFGPGEKSENNLKVALAGYEYAAENMGSALERVPGLPDETRRMLLNGNEAIALGAIAAGCSFMSAYPMTPASSIMEYLISKSDEMGIVVIQPEDEISAINMTIGAAFAGARAMTATSGGGFCLMVEGLGLAGMTETPIVVVDAQRPGPAIGLPTRTEQSDLLFAVHASHGEFPRAVLAPASVEDAFWLTIEAFNLADRFQLPVIVLTDHYLASSYATVEEFDLSMVEIDRGAIYSQDQSVNSPPYRRHLITESGVSPRAFPGHGKSLVVTDSDEHDQEGHLIEDAAVRTAMMQKRLRKNDGLRKRMADPLSYGPSESSVTLVGWGSSYETLKEAVDILREEGYDVNLLHFNRLWPFPAEATIEKLGKNRRCFVVENNATGQLSRLIRMETGIRPVANILKFDGRPLSPKLIVEKLIEEGL